MTSHSNRDSRGARSFLRHLAHALPVIAAVTLATTALHHFHLLDSLEFAALDTYLASVAPRAAGEVVIVTVTDDDYERMFGGRSPLDPAALKRLIDQILAQEPAALGVDIVTATPEHAAVFQGFADPRVVWVQDADPDPSAGEGADGAERWRLGDVLGREAFSDPNAGLSLFPLDADRVVRRYFRQLTLETDRGPVTRPTFAAAVLRRYCGAGTRASCGPPGDALQTDESEALWFNFAGDRYSFRKIPAGAVAQVPRDLLKDKVVLLGGTFAEARDVHPTPIGQMAGVELVAFAIESELEGGGITSSNELLMLAAELLSAVVLVWLNWRWTAGSRSLAALNGAAVVILALFGSYLAFRRFGYWASFLPIGVGVWIHQLYERVEDAAHVRAELERYRRRYGPQAP